MKKLLIILFLFSFVFCNNDIIIDSNTIIESEEVTVVDSTVVDTGYYNIDTLSVHNSDVIITNDSPKEIKSQYETKITKDKKYSYEQLYWKCPSCNKSYYDDSDFKMDGDKQKFNRQCLECLSWFEIKRKKNFYECKPK